MDITAGQRQLTEEAGHVLTDATSLQEAASKIGVDVKHKGLDTRGVTEEKMWDKLKASAKTSLPSASVLSTSIVFPE